MAKGRKMIDYPDGQTIPADTILELPCDVLIPAAIGGTVTGVCAPARRAQECAVASQALRESHPGSQRGPRAPSHSVAPMIHHLFASC